jgi:hypothetical protein
MEWCSDLELDFGLHSKELGKPTWWIGRNE